MEWSTACPDWAAKLVVRESIIPPPIFPDQAEQALTIFKSLRVVDIPGRPTFGECCEQWVFDFVAAIFGAYDAKAGKQLIREFYLCLSKKNTKSTIAAGIMLTALILCGREEEEHLILAPTLEVASNSFKPAAAMVRADEELLEKMHVQDHVRTITHRVRRNSLKVVAADTEAVSGKKAGRVLIDEHWVFGKRPNAEAMFVEATGGQVSRDEGWVIYLTTQSDEPPAGVFAEKLEYFRAVRDGKTLDAKSLPVLYEFPAEMLESKAYLEPANFYITNPNIGHSVSAEWLEDQLRKVRDKPASLQQFVAKHLNVQVGVALGVGKWAGSDFWAQQARPGLTLEIILDRCDVATVGLDGGGLRDLYGVCVLGRDRDSGEWLAWFRAYAHPSVIEYQKELEPRLRDFEKAGDLVFVARVRDDIEQIAAIVKRLDEAGLLDRPSDADQAAIGVDRNGIDDTLDELEDVGISLERIKGVAQGAQLMSQITTTERRLAGRELWHSGSTLMNWCVGNAQTERKGNAVLVTKEVSKGKIDPLMALFNAVALMSRVPAEVGAESYLSFIAARRAATEQAATA